MIRGHVKDGEFEEALLLYYEKIEKGIEPDNFTYPVILKACARLLALEKGRQIHRHIFKLVLEVDVFVQHSLISVYGKCRKIERAYIVFEKMDQKSIASWSAIIGAHASMESWYECLMLFGDMNSEGSWRPKESTLISVLSACTHLGALDLGRCVHGSLLRNFNRLNVVVQTSLIDMYVKCGCLEKGWRLFKNMGKKNRFSYTVMISELAMYGHGGEALRVFWKMLKEGMAPNDFYVGVLSACSHAGLVNE